MTPPSTPWTGLIVGVALALAPVGAGCVSAGREGARVTGPTLAQLREQARLRRESVESPASAPEDSAPQALTGGQPSGHLRSRTEARPRLSDDSLHSLELRGASLGEALHLISSMAGVNVYLSPGLEGVVDASFPAVTLDAALNVLLDRNDLALVEEPAGVFWVESNAPDEMRSTVFELQAIRGEDVLENVALLIGSRGSVAHDPNQNFLVVRAAREDIEAVGEYLALADRLKPQVLIEVEILEVALDDSFEFGVQQILQDPNFVGEGGLDLQSDLSTSGDAFSAVFSLNQFNWDLTINALSTYGAVEVLSSPRVLAITNTPANIEVITEVPYIQTTSTIDTSGTASGISSQASIAFKEAGIKLKVTPVVQEGDVVQLTVEQEFSEVVDFFEGVPVIDARIISNQFLVKDRDAVVIGGLIQSKETKVDQGVPVLMHLPLLGRLFRSDKDVTQRRELLVLITPRVLAPQEAAGWAGKLRSEYSDRRVLSGLGDTDEELRRAWSETKGRDSE